MVLSVFVARPLVRGVMRSAAALLVMGLAFGQASNSEVPSSPLKITFDPAPEAGLPAEARRFKPSDAATAKPFVGARVLHDADVIRVRYFSEKVFGDARHAEAYLARLVLLRNGMTTPYVHWAEGLGVPLIEAVTAKSDSRITGHGRLLVWRGRAAHEDREGNWWFTSWSLEEDDRLLAK